MNKVPTRALAIPARSGKRRMLRPKHRVKVTEPLMKTTAIGITRLDSEQIAMASHAIMILPTKAAAVAISVSGSRGTVALRIRLARLPEKPNRPKAERDASKNNRRFVQNGLDQKRPDHIEEN